MPSTPWPPAPRGSSPQCLRERSCLLAPPVFGARSLKVLWVLSPVLVTFFLEFLGLWVTFPSFISCLVLLPPVYHVLLRYGCVLFPCLLGADWWRSNVLCPFCCSFPCRVFTLPRHGRYPLMLCKVSCACFSSPLLWLPRLLPRFPRLDYFPRIILLLRFQCCFGLLLSASLGS